MNEEIFKYEIPKHVVNNLLVFLKKTPLIGEEVPEFVKILNVFNNPIKEENTETQK